MANFQVLDAYGSVITIQSSTFGSAERQAVQAFIGGGTVSIVGTVTPSGNQSVSGTVNINPASVQVLNPVSLLAVNPNPSSVFVINPVSILAVNQGTPPWAITNVGSVITTNTGSIITVNQGSSILSVPVGSVITVLQAPSIVGSYAEDAGHATGDKGLFVLGVRNDTLSSITSADNDYSPIGVDPTGAITTHDAPITKWVQGTADLRVVQGASVTAIAAQGASVFTYIREIQVANMGSASVLVTFAGGLGSILGYTIAPAGGGSNFITRLKTGENSAFTASISGIASVVVAAQGFISKT